MRSSLSPRTQSVDVVRDMASLVNQGRLLEVESHLIALAEDATIPVDERCQLARLALSIDKPWLRAGLMILAVERAPRSPEVRFVAGLCERSLGHVAAAKSHFLEADPERNPDAAYYLSLLYESEGAFDEARREIDRALLRVPGDADYLNQSSCLHAAVGEHAVALRLSSAALESEPDSPGLAFNHAQNLLLFGRYEEAWPLFEARLAFLPEDLFPRNGSRFWEGQSLDRQSILVWNEQGFGDTIQFARYLPVLARAAERVVFRCPPELCSLLRAWFPEIEIVSSQTEVPRTTFHVPLLSLPARLAPLSPIPPRSMFTGKSDVGRPKRIAFACSGNPSHPNDAARTVPMRDFALLWDVPAKWECFQRRLGREEHLRDDVCLRGQTFRTFSDTVSALDDVDLVISVDTALGHLAASYGIETWIMLGVNPDWRWGLSGTETAWYPSARLFRRGPGSGWCDIIEEIRKALL